MSDIVARCKQLYSEEPLEMQFFLLKKKEVGSQLDIFEWKQNKI